jgi:hypothetical protein
MRLPFSECKLLIHRQVGFRGCGQTYLLVVIVPPLLRFDLELLKVHGENAVGRITLPVGRILGDLTPRRDVELLGVVRVKALSILCELIGFPFPAG